MTVTTHGKNDRHFLAPSVPETGNHFCVCVACKRGFRLITFRFITFWRKRIKLLFKRTCRHVTQIIVGELCRWRLAEERQQSLRVTNSEVKVPQVARRIIRYVCECRIIIFILHALSSVETTIDVL